MDTEAHSSKVMQVPSGTAMDRVVGWAMRATWAATEA